MDTAAVLLLFAGILVIRYIEEHHRYMSLLNEHEKLKGRVEVLEGLVRELRDTCVYLNMPKYKK